MSQAFEHGWVIQRYEGDKSYLVLVKDDNLVISFCPFCGEKVEVGKTGQEQT